MTERPFTAVDPYSGVTHRVAPRELANLHAFPPAFGFAPGTALRQQYALLGNSLSVAVVADLLRYLLAGVEGVEVVDGGDGDAAAALAAEATKAAALVAA